MSRIAVDIVLLPDAAMTERALRANTLLVQQSGSEIVLSADDCLPHVSLAMGCIESGRIRAVHTVLQDLARDHPLGELVVTGIVTTLNAQGRQNSSFALANTVALQALHEDVTHRMQDYFSYDPTPEMIYGGGPVAESTLAWIRTFREKSSFGVFFPHITIGYGPVCEAMTFPLRLGASRLALCHLGNHCTCRKILASVEL